MAEENRSKRDFLLNHGRSEHTPVFFIETLGNGDSEVADSALMEAFQKQWIDNMFERRSRQDFLADIIFNHLGIKLPQDATREQREEAKRALLNKKNTKLRFIFSKWPRPTSNPDAPFKSITPENSVIGKMAPNGNEFWGETLFDFFYVQRYFDRPYFGSISTGSKLARWAKANGEADGPAKHSIEWAEKDEGDPKLIPVCDIQPLIKQMEYAIRYFVLETDKQTKAAGKEGQTGKEEDAMMDLTRSEDGKEEKKEKQNDWEKDGDNGKAQPDRWALPERWPPRSVFDSKAYPRGWFTDAFSFRWGIDVPTLEHYIPQSRLPEYLIVHDPQGLLDCMRCGHISPSNYPCDEGPKVPYRLALSDKYNERRKADEDQEAAEEARAKKVLEAFLASPHSSLERPSGIEMVDLSEPGWTKPAVFVVFPPRPPLRRPEEAHLYLSPNYKIGEGSHSIVYKAEMLVPRSWLVHDQICMDCVKEDVKKILEEEDGTNGERRLKKWDEKTGMVVCNEIEKRPLCAIREWEDVGTVTYVMREGVFAQKMAYEGPYRVIHTRVKYQNLEQGPLCEHLSKGKPHLYPLTTKVHVAAKLTIPEDKKMHKREAENYQRFPKHFFEHWSGYNVCPPMNEPVPIGPLVPQFYGYYIMEPSRNRYYQSPILLMELCGERVNAKSLSADDKNECLSLGLRMNAAGWMHGSLWERNIMKQAGPIKHTASLRRANGEARNGYGVDWSFRLIDFGRSRHIEDEPELEDEGNLSEETAKITRWWRTADVDGHWY